MGLTSLSTRLVGITAVCLAAVMAPLSGSHRTAALAAFALGVALASVLPGYDRWAAWIVGPAVLLLALAPPVGLGALVALMALIMVGFACFSFAGLERAVPALGLPLLTLSFRTGTTLSVPLVVAWVAVVVVMLVLANQASPVERGSRLGDDEALAGRTVHHPLVFGRRRIVQGLLVVALVAPVAVGGARLVDRFGSTPDHPALLGGLDGGALQAHPGLTGGLDTGVPIELGDDEVLRVVADQPRYWRGATYDQWDGRRWTSTAAVRPIVWSTEVLDLDGAGPNVGSGIDPTAAGTREETQTFTMARSGLDVLLGAWQITGVRTTARSALVGDDGSMRLTNPLRAGATWTVTSRVALADADHLRAADPDRLPADDDVLLRYAREDDVSAEVAALARQVTATAPTTYDKIEALEHWIGSTVTYTRDIEPLAEGADAVDELLLRSHRGYCEQIGTALVVMLRSLGIPARLVVGYVPGRYDGTTGEWVSLASDAHAWAEVYFPGVGWQGFDPTAGVALGPGPAAVTGPGRAQRTTTVALALSCVLWTALAVLRWRRRRPGSSAGAGPTPAGVEIQDRFDRCGAALGRAWPRSMTIREKAADLRTLGIDPELTIAAARALERATFARQESHDTGTSHGRDSHGWDGHGCHDSGDMAPVALDELEQAVAVLAASLAGAGDVQPGGTRAWERSR